ncbi:phospholipase a2 [Grosmannia clavigera kw1407]|uniref:Phospholipase a2 n=1 Tax=Grosmannia clavigera (strain kw1407 / UAMH 11150) TaxID=655863 RepID=F0X978_GROCL|nr:phospholipase a2 [Grosmannia clavigera kw1407]EFX06012.1 phospholipase a2 [Grosmannia clavigera kw1407]
MDRADPLAELISSYFELNGSAIDELLDPDEDVDGSIYADQQPYLGHGPGPGPGAEPSPLEFMRYVARNTPFVARGAASLWPAVTTWSASFLRDALASHSVNVAVTPRGNADAPTPGPSGALVFAKPWEESQPFPDFLDYVMRQEKGELDPVAEVRYAQTQNDNLRQEYVALYDHVQKNIPFARIALQRPPEAINLWIGNSHSATALHRDNYENVYVQVLGQKHFVLLPPLCQPCVNEQLLQSCTYRRREDKAGLELLPDRPDGNAVDITVEGGAIPFATWDPDRPEENTTPYSALALPMRVTLNPGDMLYLPAMWLAIPPFVLLPSCLGDGICVAVNYWYDMDFNGPLYPLSAFVRSVYQTTPQSGRAV